MLKNLTKTPSRAAFVTLGKAATIQSLLSSLKYCTIKKDLEWGRRIHENASETHNDTNKYVATALIKMYARCGSMEDARCVFDRVKDPDVVAWTVLLMGYGENGEGHTTMELFSKMKAKGCVPNSVTYISVLKACTSMIANDSKEDCLELGRKVHSEIGCNSSDYVQSTLVDLYAKCGSMNEARRVFDGIVDPDVVSWNALLLGYAENGEGRVALELFSRMKARGCVPNCVTYVSALKACSSLAVNEEHEKAECLRWGKSVHWEIRCLLNKNVQSTLINMYSKCGSMLEARRLFDNIKHPDVVSWNTLLLGYAEAGEGQVCLELFFTMKFEPNSVTYIAALKACASSKVDRSLERVREIHSMVGCHLNKYVLSTLIDVYAKCGSMDDARRVFDSIEKPHVATWNALLLGYADNGQSDVALDVFAAMKSRGCVPNSVTFVAALKSCSALAGVADSNNNECLELGRDIHSEVGHHLNRYIQNTLVDMYSKCGSITEARNVFDSIKEPVLVSWNALLSGYALNGEGHVALDMFSRMKASGCLPNSVTHLAVFKACGLIGALPLGRKLHSEITEFNSRTVTCLVGFYAKCGSISEAQDVFVMHPGERDITTWNALLAGYGIFRDISSTFDVFEAMQEERLRPDAFTLTCMLLCCSHAGHTDKARALFDAMPSCYGMAPTLVHYTCLVDVLGRANRLNEAIDVIRNMPHKYDANTWKTLLGACHTWKNAEIGRGAFQALVDMDRVDAVAFVLLARIYGGTGLLEEQKRLLEYREKFA